MLALTAATSGLIYHKLDQPTPYIVGPSVKYTVGDHNTTVTQWGEGKNRVVHINNVLSENEFKAFKDIVQQHPAIETGNFNTDFFAKEGPPDLMDALRNSTAGDLVQKVQDLVNQEMGIDKSTPATITTGFDAGMKQLGPTIIDYNEETLDKAAEQDFRGTENFIKYMFGRYPTSKQSTSTSWKEKYPTTAFPTYRTNGASCHTDNSYIPNGQEIFGIPFPTIAENVQINFSLIAKHEPGTKLKFMSQDDILGCWKNPVLEVPMDEDNTIVAWWTDRWPHILAPVTVTQDCSLVSKTTLPDGSTRSTKTCTTGRRQQFLTTTKTRRVGATKFRRSGRKAGKFQSDGKIRGKNKMRDFNQMI